MDKITELLRESKRLRLIATAIELLEFERISCAAIPIPGTAPQRYIMIGDAATVARLLEIDRAGACGQLADDPRFGQMMQEYLMGETSLEQVAARLAGAGVSSAICWSCQHLYTAQQRAEADGHCPHCHAEIDLTDSEGDHHD